MIKNLESIAEGQGAEELSAFNEFCWQTSLEGYSFLDIYCSGVSIRCEEENQHAKKSPQLLGIRITVFVRNANRGEVVS
jgi:hypothetical protein